MDITTILGIVMGAGVFVGGVLTSGKLGDFWDCGVCPEDF